ASRCIPMPSEMTYEEAAGFQIAYGTSHLAMTFCTQVTKQDTVLITGAAGGVGLTAVQIASQLGARVIAVARGEDKLTIAREAGADITLDASTADLGAKLKELGGADVVYDTVGGKLFDPVFRACKVGGRFLVIGFAGGEVPQVPANILLVKNIQMIGLYWGGYRKLNPKALNDSLAELMRWYSEGRIKPPVGHTFPLEKTAEGLELMRSRQSTGKIVITMPE
ncbi:MAG: NADPH:quinone oxidoreductase family protein, partial [Mangrovicoccus sp.]